MLLADARVTARSPTTAAATAGPTSRGTATTWTPTPTIWPTLVEALDLTDAIHVGHSTGGGEVARYIGRHGTARVAKIVLVGAVPPLMVKTRRPIPGGLPIDRVRRHPRRRAGRPRRSSTRTAPALLRLQPARRDVSQGVRDYLLAAGHAGRAQGGLRLHQAVLGDRLHRGPEEHRHARCWWCTATTTRSCRSTPPALTSAKILKNATLKIYAGAPHGLSATTARRSTPTCWPS